MDTPSFYFCICPDNVLSRRQLSEITAHWQDSNELPEMTVYWGDENLGDTFWIKLTQRGLIARKKILLVRQAQLLPAETWKKISTSLGERHEGIFPVFFVEGAWEKGQIKLPAHLGKLRCFEFAKQQNWVWQNPGLDSKNLNNYLTRRAKLYKLQLSAEILNILVNTIPPDAGSVDQALEQLSLSSQDGKICSADVINLGVTNPELIVFDFIRSLENDHPVKVWKSLLQDDAENLFFPFLSLMNREVKQLWVILHGGKASFPSFLIKPKTELANRVGRDGLANILKAIVDADWTVKTNQRQTQQALDELIATMTILFHH